MLTEFQIYQIFELLSEAYAEQYNKFDDDQRKHKEKLLTSYFSYVDFTLLQAATVLHIGTCGWWPKPDELMDCVAEVSITACKYRTYRDYGYRIPARIMAFPSVVTAVIHLSDNYLITGGYGLNNTKLITE